MWTTIVTALAAVAQIILKGMNIWQTQQERTIGKQEAAIDGMNRGEAATQNLRKIQSETGKMDDAQLDAELSKWMRDKPPDSH